MQNPPSVSPPETAAAAYSAPAIAFHWLIVPMVLCLIGVGVWMVELEIGRQKLVVYGWHKWFGLAVLAIAIPRLAWRLWRKPPPLPAHLGPWERSLATLVHWGLYALLLAMPISGWLMTSAAGQPVVWFAIVELPDLVGRDPALVDTFRSVHHWLSRLLIVLLVLHIAAVVRHDVLRRDGVLRRMLPGTGVRGQRTEHRRHDKSRKPQ